MGIRRSVVVPLTQRVVMRNLVVLFVVTLNKLYEKNSWVADSRCDAYVTLLVLRKMQNPGSPNGPPMVDACLGGPSQFWVVRLSSGWSVNQ